jgi:hypothetical protein
VSRVGRQVHDHAGSHRDPFREGRRRRSSLDHLHGQRDDGCGVRLRLGHQERDADRARRRVVRRNGRARPRHWEIPRGCPHAGRCYYRQHGDDGLRGDACERGQLHRWKPRHSARRCVELSLLCGVRWCGRRRRRWHVGEPLDRAHQLRLRRQRLLHRLPRHLADRPLHDLEQLLAVLHLLDDDESAGCCGVRVRYRLPSHPRPAHYGARVRQLDKRRGVSVQRGVGESGERVWDASDADGDLACLLTAWRPRWQRQGDHVRRDDGQRERRRLPECDGHRRPYFCVGRLPRRCAVRRCLPDPVLETEPRRLRSGAGKSTSTSRVARTRSTRLEAAVRCSR